MDTHERVTENNDVFFDIPLVEIPPARRITRTAAMNADLLRRLNNPDDDIDE